MKRLRICFVCNEYPPGPNGGIGIVTQVLGRSLVRAGGHDVRVVGLYHRNWPAPAYEEDQGVKVWRLQWSRGRAGWVESRWRLFQLIASWARAGEIDLVEVPDWEGMAAGWPALSVPVVMRAHGSVRYFNAELARPTGPVMWLAERASMKRADDWIAVSHYLGQRTQDLFGLPQGPSAILYNRVEIPPLPCKCRDARAVVFTGTLTPKKGVITLAKAWTQVVARFPDARLHMFGKDTIHEGQSMQAVLGSLLGSSRRSVTFHGHVDNAELLQALKRFPIAVFPSYAEGMGIAPLEAMACGCATIFSRCGPGDEFMRDEQDGFLVDPDRPEDIADKICRLLADEPLAQQLGLAGRARVTRDFSIDALPAGNLAFYDRCLEDFRLRRAS